MIPIGTSIPLRDISAAVIGLIFANVLLFLVQTGLPEELAKQFIEHNALIPARYFGPGFATASGLDQHNYWPLLTNQFMHAGWLHLIVNMWVLWVIGRPLEQRIGALRFILFYLACGLLADMAHIAADPISIVPALGASGAIAGILGGYAMTYPRSRVHLVTPVFIFPVIHLLPAVVFVAIWFAIQVLHAVWEHFAPAAGGGIAWWAHIGGFIAGLILVRGIGTIRHGVREIDIAPAAAGVRGDTQAGGRIVGPVRARSYRIGGASSRKPAKKPKLRGKSSAAPAKKKLLESLSAAWRQMQDDANFVEAPAGAPRRGSARSKIPSAGTAGSQDK